MINYDVNKVNKHIMFNGLFSEYLPKNFTLNNDNINIFDINICEKTDYIEPYKYTMSRFSENDKRRIISLPEITSYINVVNYMKEKNLFKDLIDFSLESNASFSKLIEKDGSLYKYEHWYSKSNKAMPINIPNNEEEISTFISNIVTKLNIAKGAKGVLYLDISNFFGSIYTHIIPSIPLGYDKAIYCFKYSYRDKDSIDTEIYKLYEKLDKKLRSLNGNRTNGLLTGPFICHMVAEALLTRIDKEISSQGIIFTRYVDDYEIYIYNDNDIEKIMNTISTILNKYHFFLNNEKTKYTPFPYYKFKNLDKIITNYSNKVESYDLVELFNKFFELEENGVKGAIKYLIKSINKKGFTKNPELFTTYLLNILVNDNRSLTKVCELLINEKNKLDLNNNFQTIIKNLLLSCINSKKDLEVVWLLYLLKGIGVTNLEIDMVNNIIHSENELAIIILLYEFPNNVTKDNINKCIDSAKSWLLLYQLYLSNHIDENEFKSKTGISNNINFYKKLKQKNFSFYKPM